jgi:glucose-1-phosphate cytidylyltransferase
MKAVILAGGLGTRISEETHLKPKPMIEIGSYPILWHIMKIYSFYGVNEFVICCGYKGYLIKEYFANYFMHMSDITINMKDNSVEVHQNNSEPWKVTLVDTGQHTMTGGRLKRVSDYIQDDKEFCFTYGDGVGNIDIKKLIKFHKSHGKLATVTGSQPPNRFGAMKISKANMVEKFTEKPSGVGSYINAGFFILSPKVLDQIQGDSTVWEESPLISLAKDGELAVFKHDGFWQPMDTLREKILLNNLWDMNKAPWKIW